MLNPQLVEVIQNEIKQCQQEGMDSEDIHWMACGAAIEVGRQQGMIGDPVEPEMFAAIETVVTKQLASKEE
jgi:hypothetical protein